MTALNVTRKWLTTITVGGTGTEPAGAHSWTGKAQMKPMNTVVRTGVALLAGAALTMTGAGSASAATSHPSVDLSLTFTMAGGHHYSTGQPNPAAGNQIIQTT